MLNLFIIIIFRNKIVFGEQQQRNQKDFGKHFNNRTK